jgi:CSLREA domain-containing protein
LVAGLIALACSLSAPASAGAAEFTVDSTADETDQAINTTCLTAGGKCTLRAAIEEANENGESDEISFSETPFDGGVAGTIVLGSGLPPIVDSFTRIEGECERGGVIGPCVGVEGPVSGTALTIDHGFEVEVAGLVIGGAETAVSVIDEAERAKVSGSWFGVKLDGSAAGNANGIFVGPESNVARIGGEAASAGNVFAHISGTALTVSGADRARIFGNYFGVKPDGVTPALNGEDIEITSAPGFEAVGSSIGTAVSKEAAETPRCDRGCNLISGATSNGVDLQGDGGSETPAHNTAIAGNYFGLNATGSAPVPNAGASIRVGEAAQTVIGGRKAVEANRINGGAVGVLSGPGAANLIVRGNAVGVDAAGTASLAPPGEGLSIDSEGLNPDAEALIARNEIAMEGGIAIALHGPGATVRENSISGAAVGIRTSGSSEPLGNLVEGNVIANAGLNAILLESNGNEALGNEIVGAGGAGIRIAGPLPFGNRDNLVGGDVAADENRIFDSGGSAIEIAEPDEMPNEVARNRGAGNVGPFIDLVVKEPKKPTYRIEPPPLPLLATRSELSGKGEAGSRVRVFRKASPAVGELDSFLGETIVGADGKWKVGYATPIAGGTIVAATQSGERRGTSELATAVTPAESSGGGSVAAAKAGVDTLAPVATILKGPKRKSTKTTASFKFDSDESGSRFECKLDDKPFKPCESPRKYRHLRLGKHVFKVRAIDSAGNVGAPVMRKFTVVE